MKRKFRIVGTVVALCLSIAMLGFGVYAATSVTLNVTGTVSFTVEDVFVDVTGSAYLGAANTTTTAQGTQLAKTSSYTGTAPMIPAAALSAPTWTIGDIAFTSTNDTVVYEILIENKDAANGITVTPSKALSTPAGTTKVAKWLAAAAPTRANVLAQTGTTGDLGTTAISVPASQKLLIVVTYELTNKSVALTTTNGKTFDAVGFTIAKA